MANEKKKSFIEEYLQDTRTYAYSLILILPLVLIYEAGILLINEYRFSKTNVLANEIIVLIFDKLGLQNVNIIPALLVLVTLFLMQFKSNKKWEIRFSNVMLLHFEYLIYAVILFMSVAWMFPGRLGFNHPHSTDVVIAIGAGVYEEYLFRLLFLSILIYFFEKSLKVENRRTIYVAVVVSAFCFAGFHHMLGREAFNWADFLIRSAAGIYFGFIFLTRGYGVCAGTHIGFNILILLFC